MSAATASLPGDPHLGRVLKGTYRIDKVLGAGAMGVVYRGEHLALRRPVAIKTLKSDAYGTGANRERFEREAAIAAKLTHPGVAQVFDFGIDDGLPFLVMELVEGPSLDDVIQREGTLPPARVLSIARQLIAVLGEAHRMKLVHRDIKPDNLRMLRYSSDAPPVVKVLDFGIAKEMGIEQAKLTATGAIMGTPLYISPEQATGVPIDGRSDQYSSGAVIYEMLSGRPPVVGTSLASILVNQISRPPAPMPDTVPEPLRKVVLRMLAKSPAERYPDDDALDKALAACERACANANAAPRPDPETLLSPPTQSTPKSRGAALKLAAAAVLLSVLAVALVLELRNRSAAPAPLVTRPPVSAAPTGPSPLTGPDAAKNLGTDQTASKPSADANAAESPSGAAPGPAKKNRKSSRKRDNPYAVDIIR